MPWLGREPTTDSFVTETRGHKEDKIASSASPFSDQVVKREVNTCELKLTVTTVATIGLAMKAHWLDRKHHEVVTFVLV